MKVPGGLDVCFFFSRSESGILRKCFFFPPKLNPEKNTTKKKNRQMAFIFPLCRRDRFKNPACTDKPINPPWTPPVYRFIGLSAQATPGPCPFIGLSVYRRGHPASQTPWASPAYRFIGLSAQATPGPCPFIGLSVYRRGHPVSQTPRPASQTSPLGLPRTSVYRRTHFVREELHV